MNAPQSAPAHLDLQRLVLDPIKATFIGKDTIIDLLGLCLIAGEHCFLLGPPGTAKSALVQALARRLDARTFDYLLTRFTEPNELFGPFDLRRLREGDLVTNTEGMLPEADIVFLDELLNANSAVLNALLQVLNERIFRRGRETRELPLLMAVGASNRLPEDEALGALFDRFLVRVRSDYVGDDQLGAVLEAGWRLEAGVDIPARLPLATLQTLRRAVAAIDLTPVRTAYLAIVRRLRRSGMALSDRRAVRLQRMVAASAVACGRAAAQISDCWILRHCWDSEEQRELIAAAVQTEIDVAERSADEHPQVRQGATPAAEDLARALDDVAAQSPGEAARDALAILAARIPWVAGAVERAALQERADALWKTLA